MTTAASAGSAARARLLLCVFTGFSQGLPFFVIYNLLPAWLRSEGIELRTIGALTLLTFPYTVKFLWAPVLDRYAPFGMGRRRGWALVTQLALLAALASFSLTDPHGSIPAIVGLVLVVSFLSASQDVVLEAQRRELLADAELGLGNALFVNAYRVAGLIPGSLALTLADPQKLAWPWPSVHLAVAAFMGVGILTTLAMPEPSASARAPSLREAVVEPFREFFARLGPRPALLFLAFLLLYKLGDSMATALATPFYIDLGFTLSEIGATVKVVSLWASVLGSLAGGALMLRIGIHRALWLFGALQLVAILGFAVLAELGHQWLALFCVVSFEYLAVGMGTAAFVAFIASRTSKRYTGTQLALLTSVPGLPRTFANAWTGVLIESLGYTNFYLLCAAIALPGLLLLPRVAPWREPPAAPGP